MAKGYKTGGRETGTPNRITKDLKECIKNFLDENFDEVIKIWNDLEPKDKLSFYKDLLQYIVPKQKEIDATLSNGSDIKAIIVSERGLKI